MHKQIFLIVKFIIFRNEEDVANEMLNECFGAYQAGGYSPKFLNAEDIEPGTIVVTEEDDTKRLEFARMQVVDSGKKVEVNKSYFSTYALTSSNKKTYLKHFYTSQYQSVNVL